MMFVDSEEEVNLASMYLSVSVTILQTGFELNPLKKAHSLGAGTSSSNSLGK